MPPHDVQNSMRSRSRSYGPTRQIELTASGGNLPTPGHPSGNADHFIDCVAQIEPEGQFSSMARRLRLRLEPPQGDAGDLREEWRADFSNRGAKYYETTRRNSSRSIHSLFDPSFAASRGSRCCVRHPPRGASTKGKLK